MIRVSKDMHTEEYVKRLAKKLKKRYQVPHHEALNLAARELGFSNWKGFLNARADYEDAERYRIYRKPFERASVPEEG